jgi:ABC-type uncharacterized transport system substrate-binding protein
MPDAGTPRSQRRRLLGALGAALALPRLVRAQAPGLRQVAVLFAGDSEADERATQPFFDEMRRLGWAEGRNVAYERLSGKGIRVYAEELARSAADSAPDLIYATTASAAGAVLRATESVPVVFSAATDPVAAGLVESLARPGRNATGAFHLPEEAVPQRFGLIRAAMPELKRIGAVFDRASVSSARQKRAFGDAAARAGLELLAADFTNFEAVPKILARWRRAGVHAAALPVSFTLFARRQEAVSAATRNRIALFGHRVEWAEAGAVLTYGAQVAQILRRSAGLADRILRGAAAATLAVEKVTRFELALNRGSAQALGIGLPRSLVERADRVFA